MHPIKIGVIAAFLICFGNVAGADDVTRADIGAWFAETVVVDPPTGGTIVEFRRDRFAEAVDSAGIF